MLRALGLVGGLGLVLVIGGVALAAWYDLVVGGALALVVAGLGLVVYGLARGLARAFGMGDLI